MGSCSRARHLAMGLIPLGGLSGFRLAALRLCQAILLQLVAACVAFMH